MNFLAPGAFFLGLLLPVIVTFYLLKLRRIEQPVPSVYLWRRMVRDVEANAPWQKLRYNLLMILQLLFLLALIFALARPFTWAEGVTGQAAIFILDSSASMSATDVAPSRLESAKQRAIQLTDELPGSARITVIEAGREALVRLSSSLDRRQAHQAIENVRAGTGGSDMATALELASAIAARQPGTEIVVLSDGRVELPERMNIKGSVRFLPFGLSGSNQAISLLSLEAASGGASLVAFAQVSNYGSEPVDRRLSLYADGQLINVFDLTNILPGGQKAALEEGLPPSVRSIEARLEGSDALPLDDRALAVTPQSHPIRVTLVGGNNLFLKAALSLSNVELTQAEQAPLAPEGTPAAGETPTPAPSPTTAPAEGEAADLTIYDGVVPDSLPAQGSLLFIGPPASTELFRVTGAAEGPEMRALDPSDPLLAHVSLSGISVLDSAVIELPNWAVPVIGGDLPGAQSIPLLMRGETNGRRAAVFAFNLHHSDLPLNVAFPILWSNLMDWLVPGARSPIPPQVDPGASVAFQAPAGDDAQPEATVTRPDGSSERLQAASGQFLFANTTQLGLYQVDFGGGRGAAFAVNLFTPGESNLKPAASLPNLSAEEQTGAAGQLAGQREWWRYLALLALGLMMGEWLVYQRAGLSRLRDLIAKALRPQGTRRPALKGRK